MTTPQKIETEVRERIRLTQQAVGAPDAHLFRAAGISRSAFKARMRGDQSFKVGELVAISAALGKPFSYITTGEAAGADAA